VRENRNRSDKVIGVMVVEGRWDVVCGGALVIVGGHLCGGE